MKKTALIRLAVPVLCALCIAANCRAAVIGYTDLDAFTSAIAGMQSTTEDFESYPPGEVIADGGTLGGIRYDYDFGFSVELAVADDYDTTSGSRFLGTTDATALIFDGETSFSLAFDAARAVGMFFITGDPLFDGDIVLAAASVSIGLATQDLVETLQDGSDVYFLGIVDTHAASLTQIAISTATFGVFTYNIDDIVRAGGAVAVPAPGSMLLVLVVVAALASRHRRGARITP